MPTKVSLTCMHCALIIKKIVKTIESLLEQPSKMKGQGYNHTLRTGVDYFAGKKTTLGLGTQRHDLIPQQFC